MYPLDLETCTAIDVIKRSIVCHPSLFAEALRARQIEDMRYLGSRADNPAIKQSVQASANAAGRAAEYVDTENADAFVNDMAAGIIALNVACRLQCLPSHIRTSAAVRTWEPVDA